MLVGEAATASLTSVTIAANDDEFPATSMYDGLDFGIDSGPA